MGARLEQEACPAQPPDGCGVLGSGVACLFGAAPQGGRLVAPDRRHARQEVVDDGQLGFGVVIDLRRALVADPGHGRCDCRDAVGHELDDDAPSIAGVGDTAHVAGLLQAIDDARDRAGGQARQVR